MKKTTVCIDEKLLKNAVEATGARTKREAIEAGLELLVKCYNKKAFLEELGTFDMGLTLDELERLRHAE